MTSTVTKVVINIVQSLPNSISLVGQISWMWNLLWPKEKWDERSLRAEGSITFSSHLNLRKVVNSSISVPYYICRQNVFHHWQVVLLKYSYIQEKTDFFWGDRQQNNSLHCIAIKVRCIDRISFRSALNSLFCIVPSDYKRFIRVQRKENKRICYFWGKYHIPSITF